MNTGNRRGIYRVHGIGGLPDEVRVEDAGSGMEIPVQDYAASRYLPPSR